MSEARYPFGDRHWTETRPFSPEDLAPIISSEPLSEREYRLLLTIIHLAAQIRGIIIPGSQAQVTASVHIIPVTNIQVHPEQGRGPPGKN